eukprot:PhF_6_TR20044/c0_g1_i1/m.29248
MGCCPSSPKEEKTNEVQEIVRQQSPPGTLDDNDDFRNNPLTPHMNLTSASRSLLNPSEKIIFDLFSTHSSNSTTDLEKEASNMTTTSSDTKSFSNIHVKVDDLSSSTGTFTDFGSLTSQGAVYQRVDVLITLQQPFPDLK